MKKLTIRSVKSSLSKLEDLLYLENKYNFILSQPFKELILNYEGCSTIEKVYYDSTTGRFHELNQFLYVKEDEGKASIEAIYKGHLFYGEEGYIPFATDSGGWDLNISIKPETCGQVWINKFDSGEENPFEFVCESLEKFINSLITFEEAVLLGY